MPNIQQPHYRSTQLADTCDGMAWCECNDPEVLLLGALMAEGLTQIEASTLLWGWARGHMPDVALWVRVQFLMAFPWLRLPAEPIEQKAVLHAAL